VLHSCKFSALNQANNYVKKDGIVTPGATTTYARAYSSLAPGVYQKTWESAQSRDRATDFPRWSK
jgi:hypothetical protein